MDSSTVPGTGATVELQVVEELVDHLVGARGHAVLEGALGSGLGTALQDCRERLRARGVRVGDVSLEMLRPGDPWSGAGDPLLDVAEQDVDVLVVDVHGWVDQGPLDGGPAADHVDVEVLTRLLTVRRGTVCPVLVVCGGRATAGPVPVARRLGARHFVLRPWGVPEVEALLEARGLDPGGAAEVVTRSGGLPWLVSVWCGSGERENAGWAAEQGQRTRAAVEELLDNCTDDLGDAVLALAVGYPVAGGPLLPMVRGDCVAQETMLGRVGAAGFLGAGGTLPPLVRDCLLADAPPHRLDRWRRQLVDDVLASGHDLSRWAEDLAEQGCSDPRVAAALVHRASELRTTDPARAAAVLRRALRTGARAPALRVELCRLLLLAGDVPGASRELDEILADPGEGVPPGLLHVGLCLAWARDQPRRAVDLIGWTQARDPSNVTSAEVALTRYAVGDRAGGDTALGEAVRTPDLVTGAVVLTAEGVRASLGPEPLAALPLLMQAVDSTLTMAPSTFPVDSPAAHAALVGLHAGDLELVRSVVGATITSPSLGVLARSRLALLRAWADTELVPTPAVEDLVADLGETSPRDRLLLVALQARTARRADDPARLRGVWASAREVVLRHPVSLWQLLPLAELCLVAARMHEFERVRPLWQEAGGLLESLGQPPLWATPYHWAGVLIALQLDRPPDVAPHAAALVTASDHWPLAGMLAEAGRSWVRVRARDVRPAEVEAAAQGLARAGRAWEGARLAAHGAAATDDHRVSARLLECARAMRPPAPDASAPQPAPGVQGRQGSGHPPPPGHRRLHLTDRERQVAELILEGRTYRQVGEVLYLSAKTVEHHVARMRRRSGADSRDELLGMLRAELGGNGDVAR